jgi:hypothetical protein
MTFAISLTTQKVTPPKAGSKAALNITKDTKTKETMYKTPPLYALSANSQPPQPLTTCPLILCSLLCKHQHSWIQNFSANFIYEDCLHDFITFDGSGRDFLV